MPTTVKKKPMTLAACSGHVLKETIAFVPSRTLPERVVRFAEAARLVANLDRVKARGAEGQQHVDAYVRSVESGERFAQLSPKKTKGTGLARDRRAHR